MAIPNRAQLAPKAAQPKKLIDDDDITALAKERMAASGVAKPAASKTAVPEAAARADWVRTDPAGFRAANPAPAKPSGPRRGTIPPTRGSGGGDDLNGLARDRAEREAERKAAADDIAAGKARAQLDAAARSGASGMGLSGASAALQSDIGRQQDRTATLALADLDRRQRDEDFTSVQRQAALDELEAASDTDYDDDGMIAGRRAGVDGVGDGDPDNDIEQASGGADRERADLTAKLQGTESVDYNQSPFGDEDTGPGTLQEPYLARSKASVEAMLRATAPGALPLTETRGKDGFGRDVIVYVDKYGNHYTVLEGIPPKAKAV